MLPKGPYKPQEYEDKIYSLWEKGGYFGPDNCPNKETYSIVMPPANVTGTLHVGHALTIAIEDILIRYHRMLGEKTLWLPGTDHAAIATQSKVEKILHAEEGKTRHDLGREKFLKKVEKFAQDSHDTIVQQTKSMGASCDWSREAYTLDKQRTKAVRTAFKKMYDLGLIYRGHRIVNWDPKLQTTVSDDEIEYKEEKAPFYYFKYGPFEIGTSRPETKFGDKYVVVHPDDKRYKKYKHGEKFETEWITGKITATLIKDPVIDMELGTGAMTITPWHDVTDFELAEKYNLDKEQIIDFNGKLLPIAGDLAGWPIKKAREEIINKLKQKGLLVKVEENYTHRIATNSRGGGIIEPQIMKQWFINVNKKFKMQNSKLKKIKTGQEISLKELMRSVVDSGEIKIIPNHYKKIYYHWIDNLRDWCISRQIWYGHQIPAYYCLMCEDNKNNVKALYKFDDLENKENVYALKRKDAKPITVGDRPKKCPICGCSEKSKIMQDPDTLDTWFSSGLWTFSTLGWPEKTEDLKNFHPISVMETGYDILFFWVARMILMTTCLLGEIPFKYVFLHGIIRDEDKKKMSKSSGNAIDPLGITQDYGTDALRIALVFGTGQGSDIAMSVDKVNAQKKFANKIWNASKFVLLNLCHPEEELATTKDPVDFDKMLKKYQNNKKLNTDDKKILNKLDKTTKKVTGDLDNFMFHEAAQEIYQFFWHDFCDIHLESTKQRLNPVNTKVTGHGGDNKDEKKIAQAVLYKVLSTSLKLLHPFMPFITEVIYQELPKNPVKSLRSHGARDKKSLIIEDWPL